MILLQIMLQDILKIEFFLMVKFYLFWNLFWRFFFENLLM